MGKPGAPVRGSLVVDGDRAVIQLRFAKAGRDVTVRLSGQGLAVTAAAAEWTFATVATGETVPVSVRYRIEAHPARLAAFVSGIFGGRRQGRALSFTVADGGKPKQKRAGRVIDTDHGPVRILPAKGR